MLRLYGVVFLAAAFEINYRDINIVTGTVTACEKRRHGIVSIEPEKGLQTLVKAIMMSPM